VKNFLKSHLKACLISLLAFSVVSFALASTIFQVHVSGAVTASATSIAIPTTEATKVIDPAGSGPYILQVWNSGTWVNPTSDPNEEDMLATAFSGNVFTVTRAYNGTTATAKSGSKTYSMKAQVFSTLTPTPTFTPTATATNTGTSTPTFTSTNTFTLTPTPTSTPLPQGTVVLAANTPILISIPGATTNNRLNFTELNAVSVANSMACSCVNGGCTAISGAAVTAGWKLY